MKQRRWKHRGRSQDISRVPWPWNCRLNRLHGQCDLVMDAPMDDERRRRARAEAKAAT